MSKDKVNTRKTTIPERKIPPVVAWLLRQATGQEVELLQKMSRPQELRILTNLIIRLTDYNYRQLFLYKMRDEKDLAYFRAELIGQKTGLDILLSAIQYADDEIKNRKLVKK